MTEHKRDDHVLVPGIVRGMTDDDVYIIAFPDGGNAKIFHAAGSLRPDAGRDLTAADVRDVFPNGEAPWFRERYARDVADRLNRIARGGAAGAGDDEPPGDLDEQDDEWLDDADPSPRSWSLPAAPPDDVTVEYRVTVTRSDGVVLTTYSGDDRYVAERMAGADGCRAEERTVSSWRELPVVGGEPPAAEPPFAVGDRVRIKPTDEIGVVDEAFNRGTNVRFVREAFPDVEQIGYFTNKSLEPAPKPQERETIPGWEGSVGPGPGQYGKPHVYARDVTSGAGNCVCGREDTHRLHVPVPASPRGGWRAEDVLRAAVARVCPHEDCPRPKDPNTADCGEHEEWMT